MARVPPRRKLKYAHPSSASELRRGSGWGTSEHLQKEHPPKARGWGCLGVDSAPGLWGPPHCLPSRAGWEAGFLGALSSYPWGQGGG